MGMKCKGGSSRAPLTAPDRLGSCGWLHLGRGGMPPLVTGDECPQG